MTSHTHLRKPWYRPRFQGGDTQHPACMAPKVGWAGPEYASWAMTEERGEVDCPFCLQVMNSHRRPPNAALKSPRREERERPIITDHAGHLRGIWTASEGKMFPFCVIAPVTAMRLGAPA